MIQYEIYNDKYRNMKLAKAKATDYEVIIVLYLCYSHNAVILMNTDIISGKYVIGIMI